MKMSFYRPKLRFKWSGIKLFKMELQTELTLIELTVLHHNRAVNNRAVDPRAENKPADHAAEITLELRKTVHTDR